MSERAPASERRTERNGEAEHEPRLTGVASLAIRIPLDKVVCSVGGLVAEMAVSGGSTTPGYGSVIGTRGLELPNSHDKRPPEDSGLVSATAGAAAMCEPAVTKHLACAQTSGPSRFPLAHSILATAEYPF